MTKTGRAAVYVAPNEPFQIHKYPVPEVTSDEVLARITMVDHMPL